MKKALLISLILLSSSMPWANSQPIATPASSSKGAYITAGVGGSWGSNPDTSRTTSGSLLGFIPYDATTSSTLNLGGGVAADAGVGYDFGNNIRAEMTYVLNNYSIQDSSFGGNLNIAGTSFPLSGNVSRPGNARTNSLMISGFYDIRTKSKFKPYFGGGLGWSSVTVPTSTASGTVDGAIPFSRSITGGSANALGYIAKIGISYYLSRISDIFVEGIFQGNTEATINDTTLGSLNSFGVRAGARYRFGR